MKQASLGAASRRGKLNFNCNCFNCFVVSVLDLFDEICWGLREVFWVGLSLDLRG